MLMKMTTFEMISNKKELQGTTWILCQNFRKYTLCHWWQCILLRANKMLHWPFVHPIGELVIFSWRQWKINNNNNRYVIYFSDPNYNYYWKHIHFEAGCSLFLSLEIVCGLCLLQWTIFRNHFNFIHSVNVTRAIKYKIKLTSNIIGNTKRFLGKFNSEFCVHIVKCKSFV